MKNTHGKKLLACFLAALGLSMNSLNVSAKHGQIRENIKFYFGKECKKLDERNELDRLAGAIQNFLSIENVNNSSNVNNADANSVVCCFIELAKELYKCLYKIQSRRSNGHYTSKLADSLGNPKVINDQNGILARCPLYCVENGENEVRFKIKEEYLSNDKIGTFVPALKDWIKKDILGDNSNNSNIEVGNFSVWEQDGKLVRALNDLVTNKNLSEHIKTYNNPDLKLIEHGKIESSYDYNQEDGNLQFCLYEDGHLVIKSIKKSADEKNKGAKVPCIYDYLNHQIFEEEGMAEKFAESVKSVSFEGNITSIGSQAFLWFENLASVDIPNSVTEIADQAFEYCSNLTSINIPNSVTKIDHQAFSGCDELKFINIPNSVTELGDNVFGEYNDKITVGIAKDNPYIDDIVDKLKGSSIEKIEKI